MTTRALPPPNSYRALARADGFGYLILFCGGIWLFAADGLMVATLIPGIVRDIGGAHLIGWAGALFEAAAIVSGVLSAFLVRRWGLRLAFAGSGIGFALGCLISFMAPDMLTFQLGRFLQAMGGASFAALTYIGVANAFDEKLMARAMGVVSVTWGLAAFSGPLVGGLFAEFADWRTAFLYTGLLGLIMSALSYAILGRKRDFAEPKLEGPGENFPLLRLALLLAGVMAIASAGIGFSMLLTPLLIAGGLILMAGFVWVDVRSTGKRLLPVDALNPATRTGAAMGLILFLSSAVVAVYVFAPVLMAVLYGLPPLMIGYIMFVDSLGWSSMAAIFSGVPPEKERGVIVFGAGIIVVSVIVFNIAFHTGLIWLLWTGFFLQGAGFGLSWTLIVRRAAQHPDPLERDRIAAAVPTVQRVGLALGAAGLGIVANANGFADTMSVGTAKSVAQWIVGLSLPLAIIGFTATLMFVRDGRVHPTPGPMPASG